VRNEIETKRNQTKRNDVTFRFDRFHFVLEKFHFVSFDFVSYRFAITGTHLKVIILFTEVIFPDYLIPKVISDYLSIAFREKIMITFQSFRKTLIQF
jgi:hypothetical protein